MGIATALHAQVTKPAPPTPIETHGERSHQRRDTHIHQRPLLIDKLHCRQPRPACERSLGCHAIFRRFVAVFLAVRGFFRAVAAVIFPLAAAPTGDGNSRLGCFAVRWWPWCTGWMRAASSAIRSSVSLRFRRSSSRYIGIVLVVMVPVWQNYLRPSWPILATRTTHWPPRGGGFGGILIARAAIRHR
jgi:hypothetical protein